VQIVLGCCAPLCICYGIEMVARLKWANSLGIQVDPPFDSMSTVVSLFIVWSAIAVGTWAILEKFIDYLLMFLDYFLWWL
jgi:hypothetical protein